MFSIFPVCYCLVVSASAIDCLKILQNNPLCVERDVKPYVLTHSLGG